MARSRFKWMVPALGPLVVMLLLGVLIWNSGEEKEKAASTAEVPEKTKPQPRSSKVDLSTLSVTDSVPDWSASQGNFRMVSVEGRTMLELGYEPLVEGRMVWTRLLAKNGIVRARMRGERTRRNAPRFAVGVTAAATYWLRVIPLEQKLQIVGKEESVLATVPWEGSPERPVWLELRFSALGEEGASLLEGRVWPESESRPAAPEIEVSVGEQFGFGRAVVAGAPYALKPVYIEILEVASE